MIADSTCFTWMSWDIITTSPSGSAPGRLHDPTAIAIAPAGNVYVSDHTERVLVYSNNGDFQFSFDLYGKGDGFLDYGWGIAINASGHVYVSKSEQARVEVFTQSGQYLYQFGSYGPGDGQFSPNPKIAINSSGYVYLLDTNNERVQVFTQTGQFLFKWGSYGSTEGLFDFPAGIAINASGHVYVTDHENHRVQVFTQTGQYLYQFGNGQSFAPRSICTSDEYIWVTDSNTSSIQVFSTSGTLVSKWGSMGECAGNINNPVGVAVNPSVGIDQQLFCYVICDASYPYYRTPELTIYFGGFSVNQVPNLFFILPLAGLGSIFIIAIRAIIVDLRREKASLQDSSPQSPRAS